MGIEDITKNEAKQILQRFNIRVSSLPGYGNVGLKWKEILALAEQNSRTSIELIDWVLWTLRLEYYLCVYLMKYDTTNSAVRIIQSSHQ